MRKDEKKELVTQLHEDLGESQAVFVTDYIGLNVEKITKLRKSIKGAGGTFKVVKNTLLRRAAKDTSADVVNDLFIGPTAIAMVKGDPLGVAKALVDFAKDNEALEIQGGILGTQVLDLDRIQSLAKMPSKEVLLAKMLGSLNAPITNFVGVLAAMPRQLLYVLKAIENQKMQGE
ncbi:MAG TPA: 50S ribosomal protein L10 [Deltaproteobacteria bacterium]|nr:50S ribosomal protein L10 [Deltaproteobacteria bacterium]HPJ94884.1 50S ribosomal protein L10 [Deltaproteobacteria bacterium]HPR52463.1 50S ribosomal protein L10 [Deltaproteobacteria bacterium]